MFCLHFKMMIFYFYYQFGLFFFFPGVNLMQFGNIANSTRTILHSVYVFPNLTKNFSVVSSPTSAKVNSIISYLSY